MRRSEQVEHNGSDHEALSASASTSSESSSVPCNDKCDYNSHSNRNTNVTNNNSHSSDDSQCRINPFTRRPYSARYNELHSIRQCLPVYAERVRIQDAVQHNQVTLLVGETGSGKTTQVPHFLVQLAVEHNVFPNMIACTQPRRIAAISVATRVAEEMDVNLGAEVGYRVRFQSRQSNATRLLYLTDGMLLRDAFVDHDLSRYSVIIVDEAHERTVDTDVVLGLMKRLLRRRPLMRLVVMSATLDIHKIQEFFPSAPLIQVPGRVYPVEVYYMPSPVKDYVEAAIACILQVHEKEANGDVLCFLTSEYEIERTVAAITNQVQTCELSRSNSNSNVEMNGRLQDSMSSSASHHNSRKRLREENKTSSELLSSTEKSTTSLSSLQNEQSVMKKMKEETRVMHALVLPLYGSLSLQEQQKVFMPTPPNTRKIVIATNIAETSVTIDGIVYVIDCGYQKQKLYNSEARVDYLLPALISKASAEQRKGRAGRTRPGKCYRLFTQSDFGLLPAQTHPEILRSNIVNTTLLLLKLGVDNPCHFDFLDLPSESSLEDAFYQLLYFGAVDDELQLTPFGRQMAELPLDVCLARMLLKSAEHGCSCDVAIVASMLEAGPAFTRPALRGAEADAAHAIFTHPDGDHLTLFHTFHGYYIHHQDKQYNTNDSNNTNNKSTSRSNADNENTANKYCWDHFLRLQTMQKAVQIYGQLREMMNLMHIPVLSTYDAEHKTVNSEALRRAILEGFFLQVAYYNDKNAEYRTVRDGCKAVLHKQSVLHSNIGQPPRWVMYDRLEVQGEQGTFMRTASAIEVKWLLEVSEYYTDPHEIADADIVYALTKAKENEGM